MKKERTFKKARKAIKRLGGDLRASPLGRASRNKHTKGFI